MTSQELPTAEQEQARGRLFDLLAGLMRTQAIAAIAKLGIADLVSTAPIDVAEIAQRVDAHEPSLYRVMRLLASEGIFAEVEPRRFAETGALERTSHRCPGHGEMAGDHAGVVDVPRLG